MGFHESYEHRDIWRCLTSVLFNSCQPRSLPAAAFQAVILYVLDSNLALHLVYHKVLWAAGVA